MSVFWLHPDHHLFPEPDLADKSGLLAVGGDLSPERILVAYAKGIFPWYNPEDAILWWSPDPRMVLFPEDLKVSRSMRPYFNSRRFEVTFDRDFDGVIRGCGIQNRPGQGGSTWISEDIVAAYATLHRMGYVHSVEVWENGELAGGLYGLSLGRCFFGESMFARVSNASKYGFITLVQKLRARGFWLIDCQQETRHLKSLGAKAIPRREFLRLLEKNKSEPTMMGSWDRL